MKTLSKQLKQAGISLLEVLLSLGIIAIILSFAVQYFVLSSNHQKLNIVRSFLGSDMAAIQSYGINNSGYDGLSWNTLYSGGYLSVTKGFSCDSDGGNCLQVTPWGDDVVLSAYKNNATLTVTFPTAQLCQNLQESYGSNIVDCQKGQSATIYVNGTPSVS